ncbi:MAG: TonB-dependent receptor [Myxococcota bacterium]
MEMLLLTLLLGAEDVPEDYGLETVVRSSRREESLKDVPFAVTVLEGDKVADGRPGQSLGEALNQVPGLLVTSEFNANQDLRISVRGFGARAPFGVRGVRVFLDGIPLTVADGSSALDVIDPAIIQRVEVLRGPAAALYGTSAAAVILIETAKAGSVPPLTLKSSVGQLGLQRGSFLHVGESEGSDWLIAGSTYEFLGQRTRAEAINQTVTSRLTTKVGENGTLSITALGHNGPRSQDPGAIDAEEVEENRNQAGANNLRFRTGEQVRQGQVGLVYRYDGERLYSQVQAHGWTRQFRARIPFNAIELERWVGGARAIIGMNMETIRVETGVETDVLRDRRRNYGNDNGTVTDEVTLRQDENVTSLAWTAQAEWKSPDGQLRVRGATRVDQFRFDLADRLVVDGDDSTDRQFTVPTALLGAVWRPMPGLDVFANYSLAYDVPTIRELQDFEPDTGTPLPGFNEELNESQIQSAELGARGQVGPLRYEATAFYARATDELTSVGIAEDVLVFGNVGVSERAGGEAQLSAAWEGLDVIVQGSGLWSRLDDDEALARLFDDAEAPFPDTGRRARVPGAPEWLAYGQLRYRAPSGFFAAYEVRGRGPVELGPELSDYAWVSHARAGLRVPMSIGEVAFTFGVRNLTDTQYNDNFRPNNRFDRFFEPAPGRWYYGNLEIGFGGTN